TSVVQAAPAEGDPFELLSSTSDEQTVWDVASAGPKDTWVVGSQVVERKERPYAAHWDGKELKKVPVGDLADKPVTFHDVTATAPDDVWAAGRPFRTDIAQDGPRGPRPNSSLPFRNERGRIHASPR